ncbi:MAG: helix-turn-helix transcriptional regulator [Clostridia bacterium]|jgi:DNA-binding XRE family transcriptional regulator|nr:helix-turn-helix transcriptional regulator [Clostridia bacterium]
MSVDMLEKQEQIERGKRIKNIRENELHLNKSQLARIIGVSSQFLGLVEDGKGNLVYKSIKKLKDISGHSSDYILYGLDDSMIKETSEILEKYDEKQIKAALRMLKNIGLFIKNKEE